jgi:hypothetical protein
MLKCPNGTASVTGISDITQCVPTGYDIVRRVSVIPSWYSNSTAGVGQFLSNLTDFWQIGGADSSIPRGQQAYPIGTISVQALDVVVVTLDLTRLDVNMTYGQDYQISVYVDCKPCPTRYICDFNAKTPTCTTTPTIAEQKTAYQNCLNTYKLPSCVNTTNSDNLSPMDCPANASQTTTDDVIYGVTDVFRFMEPDLYKCRQLPYFCDNQQYMKLEWKLESYNGPPNDHQAELQWWESLGFRTNTTWNRMMLQSSGGESYFYEQTLGCCQCQPRYLPHFFRDTTLADLGYTDNKHGLIQLEFLVLESIELTIVTELLNAQYIYEFDNYFPDRADIYVHQPGRAKYTPSNPSRDAFINIITSGQFSSMVMPLNMPNQVYRVPGSGFPGTTAVHMEQQVLINRLADVNFGDQSYQKRLTEHLQYEYLLLKLASDNSSDLPAFNEWAYIPNVQLESSNNYAVPDPWANVEAQLLWWTTADSLSTGGNSFLGM